MPSQAPLPAELPLASREKRKRKKKRRSPTSSSSTSSSSGECSPEAEDERGGRRVSQRSFAKKGKSRYYSDDFLDAALLHRSFGTAQDAGRLVHPRLAPSTDGSRYTVGIMGLHGSGTHALQAYVSKYFDVHCEPQKLKRKDEGRLLLADKFQIWKHTVPPFELPQSGRSGSPLVMLFTVREVRSWMCSRSRSPYELFPVPKKKRTQGRVNWMFGRVKFDTCNSHCNPRQDLELDSVPRLWLTAVQGYLDTIKSNADQANGDLKSITYRLVRYEDIVLHPDKVVDALEDFGLPRNSCDFDFIEKSVDKIGGQTRKELAEELSTGFWDGSRKNAVPRASDAFTDSEDCLEQLRRIITDDPFTLVQALDYAPP